MAIYICENCQQPYCGECTKAKGWEMFCSEQCEDEYNRMVDEANAPADDQ